MKQQGKKVALDLSIKPLQPKPQAASEKDNERVVVVTHI
jgi:hypothetical protein